MSAMAEAAVPEAWGRFESEGKYGLESPELVAPGLSPAESPSRVPGEDPSAAGPLPEGSRVNALTVLTLLEKLASMLDSVQQKQLRMAQWQTGMENSVKRVQGHVSRLSKEHTSTSNMVSKLMDRSLHLSANMKEARQHAIARSSQVQRLEEHHYKIMNRSPFKVLLFQQEDEIPTNLFLKEPALPELPSDVPEEKGDISDEKTKPDEIWHTVDLSSDEELARAEEGQDDSADEKIGETRAKRIKRSGLKKVDSLKKAFTLQNIEKKMNRLVPPEKREKIKKSLSPSLRRKTVPGTVSKEEDPSINEKSIPEEQDSVQKEERAEELPPASNPEKVSLSKEPTSATNELAEEAPPTEKAQANLKITIDNTSITMGGDGKAELQPEEEIHLDSE
ncbi:caveolae-associated protein 2-like [Ambystoma mexicanum]|uniref:caveolae-associated protein 2-like n=1 Tax=Ambystoma mexicanum TaxID=8296 RepID=UPI0037E771E4